MDTATRVQIPNGVNIKLNHPQNTAFKYNEEVWDWHRIA